MPEKILNTRILNKIDTLENWNKSTVGLKKGEIAIATVAKSAGTELEEPVCMIRIGEDGIKTFSQLDWNFYAKASDVLAACKTTEGLKSFINGVLAEQGVASNSAMQELAGKVTTAEDKIEALESKFGEGEGTVSDLIADAVAAEKERAEGIEGGLRTDVDAIKNADTGILAQAKAYADGKDEAIAAAKTAGDDAMAEAENKVASVTAADASVTIGGTSTAPTVAAKISADADNAITLEEDGLKVVIPAAAEYSIVQAPDSGAYAAVYNLTKDGAIVGVPINIPKDMVVKSGSVIGDEIVLVLNDEDNTEIKIAVGSLIEYVTSGSESGDMVFITVDDTTHKVTAVITDGTITAAKLTTELQTAIGKAHSHENADVLAGINADKVAAWDEAEQNAKDYADGLDEAMNERVEALEAIDHDHANKTILDGIEEADITAWDAKVDSVTEAAGSGLKATREGNAITIGFDDDIVFVFDCGGAGVAAE